MSKAFLTAVWADLVLVSWEIDPQLVRKLLPKGLEPDFFCGRTYVSLVAFEFRDTKIRDTSIPFHKVFPEINLRLYARRNDTRGVVFLREFVPKRCVAWVARWMYNEPYYFIPLIKHSSHDTIRYEIGSGVSSGSIEVNLEGSAFVPGEDSLEHFLKENSRGFGELRGSLITYGVSHDIWPIRKVKTFSSTLDYCSLYGSHWKWLAEVPPSNVTYAVGSAVKVFQPKPV